MVKVIFENKERSIDVVIKDNEIVITGLELKPYWKRVFLFLFWWKNPVFILKNPKVIYNRISKGELMALFG